MTLVGFVENGSCQKWNSSQKFFLPYSIFVKLRLQQMPSNRYLKQFFICFCSLAWNAQISRIQNIWVRGVLWAWPIHWTDKHPSDNGNVADFYQAYFDQLYLISMELYNSIMADLPACILLNVFQIWLLVICHRWYELMYFDYRVVHSR